MTDQRAATGVVPPPPDVAVSGARASGPARRVGSLTGGWQIMVAAGWAAAFFAFAATWKTSEELGIGTWWLGPRAQPQPLLVNLFPFAITVVVTMAAIYNVRHVAWVSLGAAVAVAMIAVPDIERSGGLAAIEFAIAIGTGLVSAGALAGGRYRPRRDDTGVRGDQLPPPPGPAASFDPPSN